MAEAEVEDCTKFEFELNGKTFFVVVGDGFVISTAERENDDPKWCKERQKMHELCEKISRGMGKLKDARVALEAMRDSQGMSAVEGWH